jgi:hypothetical protein
LLKFLWDYYNFYGIASILLTTKSLDTEQFYGPSLNVIAAETLCLHLVAKHFHHSKENTAH